MRQKNQAKTRHRGRETASSPGFENRPPAEESCCGAAIFDREEKTDKIRLPALIRVRDLLENAKVLSPHDFNPRDFLASIQKAEYGECALIKEGEVEGKHQHRYFALVNDTGVKYVLTTVPDDIATMISDGKIFMTIENELYCLTKADGI